MQIPMVFFDIWFSGINSLFFFGCLEFHEKSFHLRFSRALVVKQKCDNILFVTNVRPFFHSPRQIQILDHAMVCVQV